MPDLGRTSGANLRKPPTFGASGASKHSRIGRKPEPERGMTGDDLTPYGLGASRPSWGTPVVHLVAAFASPYHAREAVGFISRSSVPFEAAIRPDPVDHTFVDSHFDRKDHDRMTTLLLGVHAIVVSRQAAPEAMAVA